MIFPLTNYVIQNKACCLNFNWKFCNCFCSASCCWPEAVKRTLARTWSCAWAYYSVWSLIINQLPERTSKPRTGSGAHQADRREQQLSLPARKRQRQNSSSHIGSRRWPQTRLGFSELCGARFLHLQAFSRCEKLLIHSWLPTKWAAINLIHDKTMFSFPQDG